MSTTTPHLTASRHLPDEQTLAATVVALEEHGFSVEVVDDLAAAREAVLARIPEGSSVMTNTSVTLQETGIADAINDGGPYDSARNKMLALDFATQAQEMKAIGGQPDYALGSVHAVTRDGTLVIASASGSQLASYAWGAANVIFVVGAQKLVPTLDAARERIYQHSLVTRGRSRVRRLRAEQLRRQDPRDPPGAARPHPRRAHPPVGRFLMTRERDAGEASSRPWSRSTRRSITSAARRPVISSSSTATTSARIRGKRFARSNASSNEWTAVSASPSGISRSPRSTRTRSRRRPPPRQQRSKTASGTCTSCSSIARRRSRMTICSGMPPSSGSTSARFDRDRTGADVLARIRRDVESGMASGEVRGTPTLFIDGVVHRGGYDAATLMEALAR